MGAVFKKYIQVASCSNCGPLYCKDSVFEDLYAMKECPKCHAPLGPPPVGVLPEEKVHTVYKENILTGGTADFYYKARLLGFRLRGGSWAAKLLVRLPLLIFAFIGVGSLLAFIIGVISYAIDSVNIAVNQIYGVGGILQAVGGRWLAVIGILSSVYFGIWISMYLIKTVRNIRRHKEEAEQKEKEKHLREADKGKMFVRNRYENKIDLHNKIHSLSRELKLVDDPGKYFERAHLFLNLGNFHQAIQDFTIVLESRPDYTQALEKRADAYGQIAERERAIEDYQKILELSSTGNTGIVKKLSAQYKDRGGVHFEKEEFEKAINDYTKALELNQEDKSIYLNRGFAFSKVGKDKEAENDFSRYLGKEK